MGSPTRKVDKGRQTCARSYELAMVNASPYSIRAYSTQGRCQLNVKGLSFFMKKVPFRYNPGEAAGESASSGLERERLGPCFYHRVRRKICGYDI
jgi:hypothetical protein